MLTYVFAAVFAALAWAAVWAFGLPLWPAVAATLVIAVLLCCVFGIGVLKKKRAAAKIEKGLEEQGARQAKRGRPDRQHEIASMQADFRKAVRSLKTSKLGRGGSDALATLPWYVIVGPPGGGKTTALLNAGLRMPYQAKRGVRGVGGTRNCDWWLTNNAILLDTAGRWTTEDEDREEWVAFLDLVKRSRPGKPLNGIFLAVAVDKIDADEEARAELAERLRERLDEITQRLDVVLPVYLLITKCDLLPGFSEMFADLRDKERAQIWGVTLPLGAAAAERIEHLREGLSELETVLEHRGLVRMGDERRLDARRAIYELPQQFGAVRGALVDLAQAMFPDNAFEDTAVLRGVYFTSGTQVGQPIDRVVGKLAQSLGLPATPGVAAAPAKPRSYFLRDVFMNVVFPDRDAAMLSSQALRKQRLTKIGVGAAALLASLGVLLLPFKAYLDNRQLISEAELLVETLAHAKDPLSSSTLTGLATTARRMSDLAVNGPGVFSRFGMYPGEALLRPVEDAISARVVQPLLVSARQRLEAIASKRTAVDPIADTAALTFYLLATDGKLPDEPNEHAKLWRERWIPELEKTAALVWMSGTREGRAAAEAREALVNLVRFHAHLIPTVARFQPRDARTVTRARQALNGSGGGDPIEALMANAPGLPADIALLDVFGAAASNYRGGDKPGGGPGVRGAFTPAGWQVIKGQIKARLVDATDDDSAWVLGASVERRAIDPEALQNAYFRAYVDEWKSFFGELQARAPRDLDDATTLLEAVVRQKPLESLWARAQENLIWKDEAPLDLLANRTKAVVDNRLVAAKKKLLGQSGSNAAPKAEGRPRRASLRTPAPGEPLQPEDLALAFSAFLRFGTGEVSGVARYTQIVNELLASMQEEAPDVKQFRDAFKRQRLKLANEIVAFNESGWEGPVLERLLFPPLTGAEVAVLGTNECAANRKWRESVVTAWEQMIEGKYPFVPRTAREAQVADVERFFMPQAGVLWQYYLENLAADLNHPAGTTIFQLKSGAGVKYTQPLLTFLKHAQELTDFLFASDKGKLGFTYAMRVKPSAAFSEVRVDLGTSRFRALTTREEWKQATFPSRMAHLVLQGQQPIPFGIRDREWALFRLLDLGVGRISQDPEPHLLEAFPVPGTDATLEIMFKPVQLVSMWKNLGIPKSIVAGASGCGR